MSGKVFHVAMREFLATVATKGFIIGILIMPAIVTVMIFVFPRLIKETPPKIEGEVAVIDPTGEVAAGLREYLRPERIVARREEQKKKIDEAMPEALKTMTDASPQGRIAMQQQLDAAMGEVPQIDVTILDADTDLEEAKAPLKVKPGGARKGNLGRLAVIAVHPDAVTRAGTRAAFGTYDFFVRGKLDDRMEDEIKRGMADAIVAARVRASGLDRVLVESLTRVGRIRSVTVTAEGEAQTNEVFNALLPAGFMVLLLGSVLMSGTNLLTTTVEEKANRVVEVLLSAVSPMELMLGKILGQMAVGFVVLLLYAGLGLAALVSFAMVGLLDPKLLLFLVIFYILSYFTIASLMAAVGAAVNEMREAQNLNTPIMLLIMIPWILWLPISRDPGSMFATILSFIPPVGNFVMLLRMTSTSPPPMWQTWLCVLVGIAGAYGALWFAAKVFRIGLLMFGKPPSLGTLIRWARMS